MSVFPSDNWYGRCRFRILDGTSVNKTYPFHLFDAGGGHRQLPESQTEDERLQKDEALNKSGARRRTTAGCTQHCICYCICSVFWEHFQKLLEMFDRSVFISVHMQKEIPQSHRGVCHCVTTNRVKTICRKKKSKYMTWNLDQIYSQKDVRGQKRADLSGKSRAASQTKQKKNVRKMIMFLEWVSLKV